MHQKSLVVLAMSAILFSGGCSSNKPEEENNKTPASELFKAAEKNKGDEKGIGKFKSVQLTHPLDEAMISRAQPVYDLKCFACHKLTGEKLVGPGWKGVTDRRTPEWIMNFITNTEVMLDSDLVAQQMFVTCLVRMPNQTLTDNEARDILEFMRKNDNKK
jgi:cytochrome c